MTPKPKRVSLNSNQSESLSKRGLLLQLQRTGHIEPEDLITASYGKDTIATQRDQVVPETCLTCVSDVLVRHPKDAVRKGHDPLTVDPDWDWH